MITEERAKIAWKNSKFILEKIAEAKKGDNIIMLADSESYHNARLFCECAKDLGINSFIADVDIYGGEEGYDHIPIMEPLRQAVLHADIAFMVTPQIKTNFAKYLGSDKDSDAYLTGVGKRYIFEIAGLDKWDINEEEVLRNRSRAERLFTWLKKADEVHVTTEAGTDFYCKVGSSPDGMYPVEGIIPFYSEVAVIPSIGSANGVVVADGASERAYNQRKFPIRANLPGYREIYKKPLRMVYKDSVLVEYSGDDEQVKRLDKLIETVSPKPNLCDELGIVATTSVENNIYGWQVDGSHQIHCVHVALGNNSQRGEIIHSTEHIDFDVHDPVIYVDGNCIYKDGKFNDELIDKMGRE